MILSICIPIHLYIQLYLSTMKSRVAAPGGAVAGLASLQSVCVYIDIYIYIYTCTYIYIYIYTCTYIYIYILYTHIVISNVRYNTRRYLCTYICWTWGISRDRSFAVFCAVAAEVLRRTVFDVVPKWLTHMHLYERTSVADQSSGKKSLPDNVT